MILDAQAGPEWLRGWLLAENGLGLDAAVRFFLWGMAGSWAVELLAVIRVYEGGRSFPARYRKKGFWAARVVLGLLGGLMAVAYGVQSPILAFHIGATAPLIVGSLSRNPPEGMTPAPAPARGRQGAQAAPDASSPPAE